MAQAEPMNSFQVERLPITVVHSIVLLKQIDGSIVCERSLGLGHAVTIFFSQFYITSSMRQAQFLRTLLAKNLPRLNFTY